MSHKKFKIVYKLGATHSGNSGNQGNSGNFQVEENLRKTQGILIYLLNSGKF